MKELITQIHNNLTPGVILDLLNRFYLQKAGRQLTQLQLSLCEWESVMFSIDLANDNIAIELEDFTDNDTFPHKMTMQLLVTDDDISFIQKSRTPKKRFDFSLN